jgi:membrane protein
MSNPLTAAKERAVAGANAVRGRFPALDHLFRAYTRYTADTGDRLAAAVTYFGFLAFFPLVVLAVSVLGFVLANNDTAIVQVQRQFEAFAPGLASQLPLREIVAARQGTGILGLVGLLYAGLGWVDALREAIRTVWHHNVKAGNIVVRKVVDVTVLAGLGLTLAASVVVSGLVSSATSWLLALVGLADAPGVALLLRVLGLALVVLVDVAVFLYLFIRLPRLTIPWRRVVKGAVFAAVGFEVLKYAGAFYVRHTTANPVYGTFAVIVGLLIWINLVSRFLLFAAAWTVTAPYDTDVAPSGTAGPKEAEKAGVPKEFADPDADGVRTLQEDGAPSPLRPALQGKPGVGFGDEEPGEQPAGRPPAARAADTRRPVAPAVPHEHAVRAAGRVGAGALVAAVLAVVVLGARCLRDLVRG